ncbi:hypothetical protein [Paenibacillus sp. NPDC058071]|uniref:hypothetical protein n=1 Tax=Paenibacillus sp. NPDC058071 TaxID=3346326 RepID=UPI0036D85181
MSNGVQTAVEIGVAAGQGLFAFLAVYMLLRLLPKRKPRWFHLQVSDWQEKRAPERLLRVLRLDRDRSSFQEREALLAGCGWTADSAWYTGARKLLLVLVPIADLAVMLIRWRTGAGSLTAGALLLAIYMGCLTDLSWLKSIRKLRSYRITREIYMMSNQLLYLADSPLNIHTKLSRCIPYTRTLRNDLEKLLAEWYHDAEQALRSFKRRIGTDEGMSFVETVDSIRLHESEAYYQLLRERIQDYKEKLELAKESRKESASYLLFMLAGIPILYTFQVFIYPWVREGQKLFESLG